MLLPIKRMFIKKTQTVMYSAEDCKNAISDAAIEYFLSNDDTNYVTL